MEWRVLLDVLIGGRVDEDVHVVPVAVNVGDGHRRRVVDCQS